MPRHNDTAANSGKTAEHLLEVLLPPLAHRPHPNGRICVRCTRALHDLGLLLTQVECSVSSSTILRSVKAKAMARRILCQRAENAGSCPLRSAGLSVRS